MFKSLKRKPLSEKILYIFVSCIFMIVALSYLYILVWTIIAGCKTHTEIVMDPMGLPQKWNFSNFLEVFGRLNVNGKGFWSMLFSSVWFSIVGSLLTQLCSITFAYCTTKYTFPGSKWVYPILIIVMTLPVYGTDGARYKLFYDLGLIDSYFQIISSYTATNAFTLFYMAYFSNMSNVYQEAARVDGAQDFQIWFKVMLPQAKPMFGAMFLTQWIGVWNNYQSALVFIPNIPTLPVGIYQFNKEMIYQARLDILFAACFITALPALILFIAFNKTITTSVSVGGVKG